MYLEQRAAEASLTFAMSAPPPEPPLPSEIPMPPTAPTAPPRWDIIALIVMAGFVLSAMRS